MVAEAKRSIVIHGHFYQPPREDPWLDVVHRQPSAAPDHDWNVRITRECYTPITQAQLSAPEDDRTVNALEYISFNFGPTLLWWMEREVPDTYARILEADARSHERLGYGNAMAQAYHHTILPLATQREKRIEIGWGIADFERRFGRKPEGLWLPETAADQETLDAVGDAGIAFVVLAPHQVDPLPADGGPGWYRTAGGARIALFPYDGGLSHDVAFGEAASDGEAWAAHLATVPMAPAVAGAPRRLVALATDGETYGHHKAFAELGLVAALHHLGERDDVTVENFASYLAHSPPSEEVTVVAPSSWSCAHGVERWRSDCGCKLDPGAETQQAWRSVLRDSLLQLRLELDAVFESRMPSWLGDPWRVLMEYGPLVSGAPGTEMDAGDILATLARSVRVGLPSAAASQSESVVKMLEMQRNALRMFTSCAWFFDDLARVEPRQVLEYAERAIELSGEAGRLRPQLLETLRTAEINDPDWDNAAQFYEDRVMRTARSNG